MNPENLPLGTKSYKKKKKKKEKNTKVVKESQIFLFKQLKQQ